MTYADIAAIANIMVQLGSFVLAFLAILMAGYGEYARAAYFMAFAAWLGQNPWPK